MTREPLPRVRTGAAPPGHAAGTGSAAAPRPTRPRSWWSWERPNRSACSTIITVALGTSTPTSMTVVDDQDPQRPAAGSGT